MPTYVLNKNSYDGLNEVHDLSSCTAPAHRRPNPENQVPLGWHPDCQSAIKYAMSLGYDPDGCFYCAHPCHWERSHRGTGFLSNAANTPSLGSLFMGTSAPEPFSSNDLIEALMGLPSSPKGRTTNPIIEAILEDDVFGPSKSNPLPGLQGLLMGRSDKDK